MVGSALGHRGQRTKSAFLNEMMIQHLGIEPGAQIFFRANSLLYFLPRFLSATFNILSTSPQFVKNFLEKLLKSFFRFKTLPFSYI